MIPPQTKGTLTDNFLNAVTCISASDCWMVGAFQIGAFETHQPLIEHWNGTAWNIIDPPTTDPFLDNILYAVACRSTSDCWAVGGALTASRTGIDTLIEHWDGNSWKIIPSPNAAGGVYNFLSGVTCTSAQCWAVGYSFNGDIDQTLIERWDGNAWTIVASPNPSSDSNVLTNVSCVSDSDCWTVGAFYDGTAFENLTAHWDGASWSVLTSPNIGARDNVLLSVACVSSSDCWAAGYFKTGPFVHQAMIQHWDGSSWSLATLPSPPTQDHLVMSVACASSSNCSAVGRIQASPLYNQTLIEHWDGTAWSIVNSPNSSANEENGLTSIACASGQCWIVGYRGERFYYDQTVTARSTGSSWTVIESPNHPPVEARNLLTGVTCLSASECWSVGRYNGDGLLDQTVTEYWNGVSWSIVPSANTSGGDNNALTGVSCVSSSDCWAVGQYNDPNNNPSTLIEHWNGTMWSVVSSPNLFVDGVTFNNGNYLNGVTCASGSACWAVGFGYAGSVGAQTLIERWDGTSWSIAPSPNASVVTNNLTGVTCVSDSDCWAVGSSYNDRYQQTLIEHWNGVVWTLAVSANSAPTADNFLNSAACSSSADCWAVGYYKDASEIYQTLIEHWDGISWSIVASPNPTGSGGNILASVTCASAAECWASGYYFDLSLSLYRALIEHWDGSSWTVVDSANTSADQSNVLTGVSCTGSSQCWAVGYYSNGHVWQALTEFLSPVQLLHVVSRKVHESAGLYDVDLTNGQTECRSGGPNGDYTLVFSFADPLSSVDSVSAAGGSGSISSNVRGSDAHDYIVQLTGVTNEQRLSITLNGIHDLNGDFSPAVSTTLSVLIGDTNNDGVVNSSDIAQTKSQSGQNLTASNFREDVTADGWLNSADIALTKSKSGTALP